MEHQLYEKLKEVEKTRFPLVVFASGAVSFLRTESEPCRPLPILPAAIFVIGTPHQVVSAAAAAVPYEERKKEE